MPIFKELRLGFQDDLGDPRDGVLSAIHVLDEALRRANLVLEIAPGFVVGARPALEHRAVPRRDPERGQRLIVGHDQPVLIKAAQRDVRDDVPRPAIPRRDAGPRLRRF